MSKVFTSSLIFCLLKNHLLPCNKVQFLKEIFVGNSWLKTVQSGIPYNCLLVCKYLNPPILFLSIKYPLIFPVFLWISLFCIFSNLVIFNVSTYPINIPYHIHILSLVHYYCIHSIPHKSLFFSKQFSKKMVSPIIFNQI